MCDCSIVDKQECVKEKTVYVVEVCVKCGKVVKEYEVPKTDPD